LCIAYICFGRIAERDVLHKLVIALSVNGSYNIIISRPRTTIKPVKVQNKIDAIGVAIDVNNLKFSSYNVRTHDRQRQETKNNKKAPFHIPDTKRLNIENYREAENPHNSVISRPMKFNPAAMIWHKIKAHSGLQHNRSAGV
jgi:hypothetical protein